MMKGLYLLPTVLTVGLVSLLPARYLATSTEAAGGERARSAPADAPIVQVGSTIPEVGVRLDAPTPGLVPIISASDAITRVVTADPTGQISPSAVPSASLALFSDDQAGPIADNGDVTPSYQRVLAWIVSIPDTHPIVVGPGGLSPEVRTRLQARTCDLNYAVDANIGQLIESFQVC